MEAQAKFCIHSQLDFFLRNFKIYLNSGVVSFLMWWTQDWNSPCHFQMVPPDSYSLVWKEWGWRRQGVFMRWHTGKPVLSLFFHTCVISAVVSPLCHKNESTFNRMRSMCQLHVRTEPLNSTRNSWMGGETFYTNAIRGTDHTKPNACGLSLLYIKVLFLVPRGFITGHSGFPLI